MRLDHLLSKDEEVRVLYTVGFSMKKIEIAISKENAVVQKTGLFRW